MWNEDAKEESNMALVDQINQNDDESDNKLEVDDVASNSLQKARSHLRHDI